jgi:hypothetical protein
MTLGGGGVERNERRVICERNGKKKKGKRMIEVKGGKINAKGGK